MSENREFSNKVELENWLKECGLNEDNAGEASRKLLSTGYNKPSKFMGITVEELKEFSGIVSPLASGLSNKLQQRQDGIRDDVVEFVRRQMHDAETLVFSKVKSDIYREMTSNLGLKMKVQNGANAPSTYLM